ncbi:MAG: hypothetical protein QNK11_00620 [Legionella sp.]|nr:hypothetical protein [Legionella sp.]
MPNNPRSNSPNPTFNPLNKEPKRRHSDSVVRLSPSGVEENLNGEDVRRSLPELSAFHTEAEVFRKKEVQLTTTKRNLFMGDREPSNSREPSKSSNSDSEDDTNTCSPGLIRKISDTPKNMSQSFFPNAETEKNSSTFDGLR